MRSAAQIRDGYAGASTALRISDLLRLRWSDVYDEERQVFRVHVTLTEKRLEKRRPLPLTSRR